VRSHQVNLLCKRGVDILGSVVLLVLLLPLAGLLSLIIRINMGSPVLYRQTRPGRDEKPFRLYKFRTMSLSREGDEKNHPSALTSLGRALRRSSLDEIPQLFNVLRGDMSLVGPRPLLIEYLPYFSERERVRFCMRPGITGKAQVEGRNTLTWDDRLALDVWYVENFTVKLDFKILRATLNTVLSQQGVLDSPEESMCNLDMERSRGRSEAD
jgi:lipopolysaccharide/colanic/teichoic acid biosynthesis glycosyltransferase